MGNLSQFFRRLNPFFLVFLLTLPNYAKTAIFQRNPCEGSRPTAIGSADLNNDGILDLAVTHRTQKTVSVMLGLGRGHFASPIVLDVGSEPVDIEIADLISGGRPEVLVATRGDSSLHIIRSTVSNRFLVESVRPTRGMSDRPGAVAVAEFNGDARLDVAVALPDAGAVEVYSGNGTGGFVLTATILLGAGYRPVALAAGDFNRDGAVDLAAVSENNGIVALLFGTGTGGFPSGTDLHVGGRPGSIAASDLERNGTLDLIVADNLNSPSSRIVVLLGDGSGSFTSLRYRSGNSPSVVQTGEFTGDGVADLAVIDRLGGFVSILPGISSGGFLAPVNFRVGTTPFDLASGDLNQDGFTDLIVTNTSDDSCSLLLGDPGTIFRMNPCQQSGPAAAEMIDLNNDGIADLAVANFFSNSVTTSLNRGGAVFSAPEIIPVGTQPRFLSVFDADLDGYLDVAVATSRNERVHLLRAQAGSFVVSTIAEGTGSGGLATGDVNRDAIPDVVAAAENRDVLNVYEGNGDGSFDPSFTFSLDVGTRPSRVAIADINRDGHADLLVSGRGNGTVLMLLGDGNGEFPRQARLSVNGELVFLDVADLDDDGQPDIVVADVLGNRLVFFQQRPGGRFVVTSLPSGSAPRRSVARDLTGDAIPDLIVASRGDDTVTVFTGLGAGSFDEPLAFGVGTSPNDVVAADFNGDGRIDVITPNFDENDCSILLNDTDHPYHDGDVDGDGQRTDADRDRIRTEIFDGDGNRALDVHNGYLLLGPAADANRDGRITAADLLLEP